MFATDGQNKVIGTTAGGSFRQEDRSMTQLKTSDELYNEKRRERAAEIIGALMRKRRRTTTDEALLDQEALRAAAVHIEQNDAERVG
jgi:hypothetical protein